MAAILIAAKNRRLNDKGKDSLMSKENEVPGFISPDMADWKFTPGSLMGIMPDKGKNTMDAVLLKLNSELQWTERRVTFNAEAFMFSKPDCSIVKDCIPIHEIKHVVQNRKTMKVGALPDQASTNGLLKSKGSLREAPGDDDKTNEESGGAPDLTTEIKNSFLVSTLPGGFNSGRTYYFQCETQADCDKWVKSLNSQVKDSTMKLLEQESGKFRMIQKHAKQIYTSDVMQGMVAFLIVANFIVSIAESEIQPEKGTGMGNFFDGLDVMFTLLFLFELMVNAFAHWMAPFFSDSWSMFDLVVVSVSVIALAVEDVPGLSTLRLMRAFRVLRLFGRLSSLRQIINALTSALIPVTNAFFIMLLVTSIYAILAVSFYREVNEVLFGTFFKSLFTMFQICTGDNWSDVARELFQDQATQEGGPGFEYTGQINSSTAVFFVSFQVMVSWTLLQVVVAVMLENFGEASDREKEKLRKDKADATGCIVPQNPLDPLLASLAHFHTSGDLTRRIQSLFQVLDCDDSSSLSFVELQEGMKKLKVRPRVHIAQEDFEALTCGREYCDENDEVSCANFELIMRIQLKLYVQRQMANAMELADRNGSQASTILFVLKQLLVKMDDMIGDTGEGEMLGPTDGETPRRTESGSKHVVLGGGNKFEGLERSVMEVQSTLRQQGLLLKRLLEAVEAGQPPKKMANGHGHTRPVSPPSGSRGGDVAPEQPHGWFDLGGLVPHAAWQEEGGAGESRPKASGAGGEDAKTSPPHVAEEKGFLGGLFGGGENGSDNMLQGFFAPRLEKEEPVKSKSAKASFLKPSKKNASLKDQDAPATPLHVRWPSDAAMPRDGGDKAETPRSEGGDFVV